MVRLGTCERRPLPHWPRRRQRCTASTNTNPRLRCSATSLHLQRRRVLRGPRHRARDIAGTVAWRDWCRKYHITAYSECTEHYEASIACYRATLRRVIFLDFDGVLHPDPLQPIPGRFLRDKPVVRYVPVDQPFVHVDLLESLLRTTPGVGLVVHSAWRHSKTPLQLRDCLGPLRHRVLEGTHGKARWRSIQAWLQDYQSVTDFLVLDNSPSEFPMPAPRQLVVCPSDTGISDPAVMSRLRAWLRQS